MGSFATSIHVKANDAATVANALHQLLLEEGYEPTEEEPERGWPMNFPSSIRAVQVSAAREGWVSLLDSEGIGSQTLGAALAGRLQTHAIQFFVNDSDSWHYQLFHAGQAIDEFDSVPDGEGFEEDDDEFAEMGTAVNSAEVQRLVQERTQQLQQHLLQRMPPELREMQQKWMASGRIVPEEMQKYNEWLRTEMPNLMVQLKDLMGVQSKEASSPTEAPTVSPRLQKHLELVRPLLKENVSDARVLEIMSKKGTFAEDALGEFLPLIGIAPFFANLSYQYLGEYTSADLARKSIQLVEHLKFKHASGRDTGPLRLVH